MAVPGLGLGLALGLLAAGGSVDAHAIDDGLVPHRLRVSLPSGPREVTLSVAPGYDIGVAASGLPDARMLAQAPTGELVLSQHHQGKVVKLADRDGDGDIDETVEILTGLNVPHGVAFVGDALYIAEAHQIVRLETWWSGSSARPVAPLPGGGLHQTRTLALGPDGLLYVSIGSSCDACVEDDPRRAAVWRLDPNGGDLEPFAHGLRNAVGLAWAEDGSALWVTDNERNELGEETPPDELNRLAAGAHFGWPACFGDRARDDTVPASVACAETVAPARAFPAHAAPLGLAFYTGPLAPETERGHLLVALHGSALRERPVGYEVVRIAMDDDRPSEPRPFVRGWLVGDESWGRPVSPFIARDGTLYLTDDKAGLVYWIRPAAREPA